MSKNDILFNYIILLMKLDKCYNQIIGRTGGVCFLFIPFQGNMAVVGASWH